MAAVKLARRSFIDLERIFEFVAQTDSAAARARIEEIREAISVLGRHPLIGRKLGSGRRALVISRGKSGYVAIYRWWEAEDTVLVLAIRHQREAGYVDE